MQRLYIALGSLSGLMTRVIALRQIEAVTAEQFERFDELHYEVENTLWSLLKSLQQKSRDGSWNTEVAEDAPRYSAHESHYP